MKFETKAIRTQLSRTSEKEHSVPMFPTSSFVFNDAYEMQAAFDESIKANVYSRYSNPSVREFENKMAILENGEATLATTSGMAAIFTTFASLLKTGDHVVMAQAVFGSTIKIFENYFSKWGISYTTVIGTEIKFFSESINENTKLLYLETPSNPGLDIFNISELAALCKSNSIQLIVDNCFATPYLQNPLNLGADICIHSATKYIDGQRRVLGGCITSSKDNIDKMIPFMRNAGPTLSPFNAWILSKSLETLSLRMERHCENALKLANLLSNHPNVEFVKYPFLTNHPQYALATKQMKAGGGIVTLQIKGGKEEAMKFISRVKMLSISPNLGDTRTIITHPTSSTHSKLTNEQRQSVGITDNLVRISVGLEHIDDIWEDINQALG